MTLTDQAIGTAALGGPLPTETKGKSGQRVLDRVTESSWSGAEFGQPFILTRHYIPFHKA